MKWSELFSSILGDKDIDVTSPVPSVTPPTTVDSPNTPPLPTTPPAITQPLPDTPTTPPSPTTPESNHAYTKEQFDALNAKITELQEANRRLVTSGTTAPPKPPTDEEIILNLCTGGMKKNGE